MENLPRHVAIIMDGNGRWARKKRLPRVAGHQVGIKSVHQIVELISEHLKGIEVLSLYAFSTENWQRPLEEIKTLMRLLIEYLRKEMAIMERNKIRFQTIGHIEGLPVPVQEEIAKTVKRTKDNPGLLLNIALNYSSQVEIVDAVRRIVSDVQEGTLSPGQINEDLFSSYLYTAGLPDPDLLIRTSFPALAIGLCRTVDDSYPMAGFSGVAVPPSLAGLPAAGAPFRTSRKTALRLTIVN